jgi:hypothetical protein
MRRLCLCTTLLLLLFTSTCTKATTNDDPAAASAAPATTTIAGVRWHASFAAARAEARRDGKPILLLQLFGRLDEEFC